MSKSKDDKCQYEYMDEGSINSELLCSICNRPFIEPISTPCDHTFCRDCIKRWIEKNQQTCPTCRQQIKTIDQCLQVSRPLRNILDRLQIKCLLCGQTGIQRENFNNHMTKICPKMNISCIASDIKCTWSGLREQLEQHLTTCKFEPLRSTLQSLINENRQFTIENQQLNEQIKQQNIQINELTYKLSTTNHLQPLLEKANDNNNTSDTIIDFSHQKLLDRDLKNILPQIADKQYSTLHLESNAITSQGIIILIDTLVKNFTTLKDLWLSNNCISDSGLQTLVRSFLIKNSTVKQLHLGSNCITDQSMQFLSELLRSNFTLTDLWLYNNQITDVGVENLTKTLKTENRTLKHLDLQWNKSITDISVNSIITMLQSNRILDRINLRKCNLSMRRKIQLLQTVVDRKDFKLII